MRDQGGVIYQSAPRAMVRTRYLYVSFSTPFAAVYPARLRVRLLLDCFQLKTRQSTRDSI